MNFTKLCSTDHTSCVIGKNRDILRVNLVPSAKRIVSVTVMRSNLAMAP
jgi:hypothetical protein